MSETNLFLRFGVAMFIGILIGMQREIAFDEPNRELPTGVRTFALLGLLGCAAAMIGEQLGEAWVLSAYSPSLACFWRSIILPILSMAKPDSPPKSPLC